MPDGAPLYTSYAFVRVGCLVQLLPERRLRLRVFKYRFRGFPTISVVGIGELLFVKQIEINTQKHVFFVCRHRKQVQHTHMIIYFRK